MITNESFLVEKIELFLKKTSFLIGIERYFTLFRTFFSFSKKAKPEKFTFGSPMVKGTTRTATTLERFLMVPLPSTSVPSEPS